MESLETQVSDLRSFLPATGPPVPSPSPMTGAANLQTQHGQTQTPHYPSQQQLEAQTSASPNSAFFGNNSAHTSPLPIASPATANHPQSSRSLSSGPAAVEASNAATGAAAGAAAAAAAGAKRKPDGSPDDASQKQQRSKRNRYISIACNECKRRKIKCNGETPCQRCGNLNLACLYAPNCCTNNFRDSDEFKQMSDTVTHLQEQVETLFQNMKALRQETLKLAPIQDRVLPLPTTTTITPSLSASLSSLHKPDLPPCRPPLLFRGPTSASFTVDVAKNTLHNMGYSGGDGSEDNGIIIEDTPASSPIPPPQSVRETLGQILQDPLWDFDRDEMIRLCRVHEEEVGIMYPVVNINDVINHAKFLTSWMESAKKYGLAAPETGQDGGINDIKTLELKVIICCALVVEEHGYSAKALRLWESVRPIADKMLMSDSSEFTNLPFLALVGGYRFLSNDEILAWRVMGQVARLCLEMGLHRREGIAKIPGEQERKNAINTFWSAYVLDRRWSFGTGFPFAVQDDNIDPRLPYPDDYPYLTSMITFSKIGAKIWKLVDYFDSVLIRELKREDIESLDREILQWYETVPEKIIIKGLSNQLPMPSTPSYDLERLQIWTRLRLNQIRIWLYTPVLHSASSINQNSDLARRVVDLAKETIQYLTVLNNNTDLYRRLQVFYHHFLTSAIAVLFLASTHAPLRFSAQCREEFHMSLELIKDMSAKSWVSQRLWRTVKSLKAYAPRLGLQQDDGPRQRENSVLVMAGTAGMTRGQIPGQYGGVLGSSNQHSSVSSGGYQPTPSPGLPPGYCSQQHPPSRMGSLTPHGGATSDRISPRPGGIGEGHQAQAQAQAQAQPDRYPPPADDRNNGIRLQTEMSRMFEGFANGGAHGTQFYGAAGHTDDLLSGHMVDYSAGRHLGHGGGGDSVYQHMREMF